MDEARRCRIRHLWRFEGGQGLLLFRSTVDVIVRALYGSTATRSETDRCCSCEGKAYLAGYMHDCLLIPILIFRSPILARLDAAADRVRAPADSSEWPSLDAHRLDQSHTAL